MPTGVLHLKEVDTDEITLDGTLSVSGLSALKGDTVLHKTLSVGETTTLAADTNATNVNLSGTLSVSGQTTIGGDILPDTNDAYDIGSPEFKIRDLYVSNNSIWVGDDMKISNVNGSLKFRKRKTNEVPKAILDAGANAGHANEQATADAALAHAGVANVTDMKLQHWVKFMRTLNAAAKLTDIFRDNDDDYEETSASDAWKEIADTNKIYANSMVGVGTSDPDDTLHVKGSFKVESETGFKLIRSSVGGTDPTVIIDTQNFGVDDTVNDLTGRGDSKYTKLYRVFGRNSEGVGRSWYWGYANDDYANISLAFDGGGIPDPDIAFTFTTASELYCNKVYAALGGNADTATLAASATKLETPRKINGVDFDGTQDITLSTEATKLATPVNINGVAFDGSSDIHINEISGASEVPIKKFASDAATDTYSYILNAPRPGTTSGGAVHFINGAGRSVDGGASTYSIRNDSGTLQLGRSDQTTKIMGNVEFEINPFSGSGSVAGITSSGGKIGMFTSSPAYPLDLSSSSYTAMRYRRSVSGGGVGIMLENGDGDSWHVGCGGNTGRFGINRAGDAFGSQLAIMQTGEFGIGTASPGKHLDVHFTGDSGIRAKNTGSGHASMYIDSYTGYSYVRFQDKGADKFYLQSTPSGDLAFRPNGGSHAMDIKSNGDVGIGGTNPLGKFHVFSGVGNGSDDWISGVFGGTGDYPRMVLGSLFGKAVVGGHNSALTAWSDLYINDPGNNFVVKTNGDVGIGDATPGGKLRVNGGRIVHTQNRTPFTGINDVTDADGRGQFVMNSSYSDLVIASQNTNGNGHGSTLSFTNINPDDNGDFRKFVIGFGNYTTNESRHKLYFGYRDQAYANPHGYQGEGGYGVGNVMIMNGKTKHVQVNGSFELIGGGSSGVYNLRNDGTIWRNYSSQNGAGIHFTHHAIMPASQYGGWLYNSSGGDTNPKLGHPNYRWGQIYSLHSGISTSDRSVKTEIKSITESEKRVAMNLSELFRTFKMKYSVETKGEKARIHSGCIAQDLIKAFSDEGLDAHRYGMFCYDAKWTLDGNTEIMEKVYTKNGSTSYNSEPDAEGNSVEIKYTADDDGVTETFIGTGNFVDENTPGAVEETGIYSIRYEELLCFILSGVVQNEKEKFNALESRLSKIEAALNI